MRGQGISYTKYGTGQRVILGESPCSFSLVAVATSEGAEQAAGSSDLELKRLWREYEKPLDT